MDAILHSLEPLREFTKFTLELYAVKLIALAVFGFLCPVAVCIQRDHLHAALRQAIADAGLSEKQAAGTHSPHLLSMRLNGNKPITFDTLAQMPEGVLPHFLVRVACLVGVPNTVTVGARLARRQARMSLASNQKAGVA
jgi:hypothetical protein